MLSTLSLVAAGLGVSLVPASMSRLEAEGVAYRPLDPVGAVDRAAQPRLPARRHRGCAAPVRRSGPDERRSVRHIRQTEGGGYGAQQPDAEWRAGHRRLPDPRGGALCLRTLRARQYRAYRRALRTRRRDQDDLVSRHETVSALWPTSITGSAASRPRRLRRAGQARPICRSRSPTPISTRCRSSR